MPRRATTLAAARAAAAAARVDWSAVRFCARDLARGMDVEREHADITHGDAVLAARIALAHLREFPDYYVALDAMERELVKRGAKDTRKQAGYCARKI